MKNNREIKFRAWHKELNKMLYPRHQFDSMCYCRDINGKHVIIGEETCGNTKIRDVYMMDFMTWNGDCYVEGYYQDVIFLQFTGLKDKNNKEIYEGDILELNDGFSSRSAVYFEDGCFLLTDNNESSGQTRISPVIYLYYWADSSVVIGNIYENSNLLPVIPETREL